MKSNQKFRLSVTLDTFQVLSNYLWLVATALDGVDTKHFVTHRVLLDSPGMEGREKRLEARGSV